MSGDVMSVLDIARRSRSTPPPLCRPNIRRTEGRLLQKLFVRSTRQLQVLAVLEELHPQVLEGFFRADDVAPVFNGLGTMMF